MGVTLWRGGHSTLVCGWVSVHTHNCFYIATWSMSSTESLCQWFSDIVGKTLLEIKCLAKKYFSIAGCASSALRKEEKNEVRVLEGHQEQLFVSGDKPVFHRLTIWSTVY